MAKNNYINFEVWKKLNKDRKVEFNLKSTDEIIEDAKKELFCKLIKKNKDNDKDRNV